MIFFLEIPIMLILVLVLGALGINLIPAIITILVLGMLLFIVGLGDCENKVVPVIIIIIHICLIVFLWGKHLDLWDIFTWLFNK